MTRRQLAIKAKISPSTLSLIYKGDRNPGSEVCQAIAQALDLPEESVYRIAGLLPAQPPADDLVDQILYELGFTPLDDKEEVLEYIRMKKRIRESRQNYGV